MIVLGPISQVACAARGMLQRNPGPETARLAPHRPTLPSSATFKDNERTLYGLYINRMQRTDLRFVPAPLAVTNDEIHEKLSPSGSPNGP